MRRYKIHCPGDSGAPSKLEFGRGGPMSEQSKQVAIYMTYAALIQGRILDYNGILLGSTFGGYLALHVNGEQTFSDPMLAASWFFQNA